MLFLSLLIYVLMWPVCFLVVMPVTGLESILVLISIPVALFIISFIMSLVVIYVLHAFNPEFKSAVRDIIRIPGAKWIAFATAIAAGAGLAALTFCFGVNYAAICFFTPIILVSLFNSFGIEFIPKMLADEQISPKLVTLPKQEPKEIEKDIVKSFSWQHDGKDYELSLVLRKAIYDSYKSKARVQVSEWSSEYVAGGICGEIRALAFRLMEIGKPYGTYDEVSFVLSFVQQALTYTRDEGEYPRYPVESLVDGIGDCEDYSILGASILKLMGYEVALLILPTHAALGVAGATDIKGHFQEYQGHRYYYCEMTGAGWKIGELPQGQENKKIDVSPVPGVIIEVGSSRSTSAA